MEGYISGALAGIPRSPVLEWCFFGLLRDFEETSQVSGYIQLPYVVVGARRFRPGVQIPEPIQTNNYRGKLIHFH